MKKIVVYAKVVLMFEQSKLSVMTCKYNYVDYQQKRFQQCKSTFMGYYNVFLVSLIFNSKHRKTYGYLHLYSDR